MLDWTVVNDTGYEGVVQDIEPVGRVGEEDGGTWKGLDGRTEACICGAEMVAPKPIDCGESWYAAAGA